MIPGDGESKKVILTDLSMGGMCIQVGCAEFCTEGVRGIAMFTLDDRHKTEVIKKFVVKSTIGNRVHCEFFKDIEYQKELGFYLRK
ncbi:hypothetical protein [Desulfopila sp. IMCC35008]|uniref:hypothetical protein n=1 Tax=Desulfopila sp. IMCC35008 TaxID=2653858 RepID=UPI0013D308EC